MKRIACLLLLLPSLAFGWGRQGHMTIAYIADGLLTPQARQMVNQLRGADGWQSLRPGRSRRFEKADRELTEFCVGPAPELALAADWADAWRAHHRMTGAYHFINLPLAGDGGPGDQAAACPRGVCVTQALRHYAAVLADQQQDRITRLAALLWVIHLAGDIFQPLHCSNDHDRGGNERPAVVMGRRGTLHEAWDSGFFYAMRAKPEQLAQGLAGRASAAGSFEPERWARESFMLAKTFVYPQYERCGGQYGPGDVREAWVVVQEQLVKAGGRLAGILNEAAR